MSGPCNTNLARRIAGECRATGRKHATFAVAILGTFLATTTMAHAQADLRKQAMAAPPMTVNQLLAAYGGKTWQWKSGGGYYQNKERRYLAATESGSYAQGRWYLTEPGKICMRATWRGNYRPVEKSECFSHRIDDKGQIFQRKEPDGKWYVFRVNPPSKTDGFSKLVPGNLIAKQFAANQKRFPAK